MELERDIIERIDQAFSPGDASAAVALISTAGVSGRIARCVVLAAKGSLESLEACLVMAAEDYRDAIAAGEYDDMNQPIRDLRVSFLIDEPLKFWIAEVAVALARRGYSLASVQTVPLDGPAVYLCEMGEGTATFKGAYGELTITKKQGQWRVASDDVHLEAHGLSRAFDDEQQFIDAVTGYLLIQLRGPQQP